MAITFISASENNVAANDDVTVTAPASIQDNDLLVAFYHYEEITDSALSVSLSGFTPIDETYNTNGFDMSTAIWYKVASSESGDYTFTGSAAGGTGKSGAHIIVLRGVDTGDPLDVTFVNGSHFKKEQDHGATGPTAQQITTESDGAWVVLFYATGGNAITNFVMPPNYDERSVIENVAEVSGAVCTRKITSFGLETPGIMGTTGAGAGADSQMYTIAIKAASGTATTIEVPTGPWR
jgi:hypothetical protein